MSDRSGIEWTDATWNPVTGCTKVSPGCDHCYAATFAERWRGVPGHHFENGFDLTLRPDKLTLPMSWRAPRRIFVNSMSDLFHADVPEDYIASVFAVMAATPQHTYQVLTKRHARMRALLRSPDFTRRVTDHLAILARHRDGGQPVMDPIALAWPLPNVWLGVSVEDQRWADIRVPVLLDTPAAVRFLSCEPLLGRLDLGRWLGIEHYDSFGWGEELLAALAGRVGPAGGLHWVIVGGESGHRARPMDPEWVRDLREQCQAARVPFLFKQWGQWAPTGQLGVGDSREPGRLLVGDPIDEHGQRVEMRRVGKHAAGRVLDGLTWDEFPHQVMVV
jgi:protein gp37